MGNRCAHGIVPVTDCYVCVSAPTAASLHAPDDFHDWCRAIPRRALVVLSVHELRQVWEASGKPGDGGEFKEIPRAAGLAEPEQRAGWVRDRVTMWRYIAAALRQEHARLNRNAGLYPQVAEDYTPDLRALAHAAGCADWCAENPASCPLPEPPEDG